jgi:hypothetical protein
LELLVGIIDAQLFKTIYFEGLKPKDIEKSYGAVLFAILNVRGCCLVDRADEPEEDLLLGFLCKGVTGFLRGGSIE